MARPRGEKDTARRQLAQVHLCLSTTYQADDLGNPRDSLDDLIYLLLSGQTGEAGYTAGFAHLRRRWGTWDGVAAAKLSQIQTVIDQCGLARQKARYIKLILTRLARDFGSATLDELRARDDSQIEQYLLSLPGVGVKIARCVMAYAFGRDVFPLDVHCARALKRLGVLKEVPDRLSLIADQAQELVPRHIRRDLHILLVQHGRAICLPRNPRCDQCCVRGLCHEGGARKRRHPTVVDLCCGAGGFSWGFLQAGFDPLLGADLCRHALQTYTQNIPGAHAAKVDVSDRASVKKIRKLLGRKRVDVVIAGPPCQGFSKAGSRNPDDPRNALYPAAMRLALRLTPKLVVFENVANLRSDENVKHLVAAKRLLEKQGYRHAECVLDARSFGVAQARRRVVVLASRCHSQEELLETAARLSGRPLVAAATVASALEGLSADCSQERWAANHVPMKHANRVIEKITRIQPGTGPLSYRKLAPDRAAQTLICGHRALPCHYAVPRTITVREAARLQGFPDTFVFHGSKGSQMTQVVNAVPPRFAVGVALEVAGLLKHTVRGSENLERLLSRPTYRPAVPTQA